ncbi:DUF4349 domain-containing protein [Peribacillus cavernae]|uniref:DUF4349 domain-containing protein n=1 Tax=Peribacillus cavernae TaxID=1674310 RepID=A0A3S1B1L4_9BACI|nr:DUF4349 domain-containing protein [Peribacillus cavernae]MDQ0219592.1 hypothetical protein [Peribacillus cavernae]RUQ25882.1 DUF4349 domain-containing protein [Peribacillus cavernae]
MKWKRSAALCILLLTFLASGCSENKESSIDDKVSSGAKSESSQNSEENPETFAKEDGKEKTSEVDSKNVVNDRMVIHNAELRLEVKNLEKNHLKLEDKVKRYGGYIVESNVFIEEEGHINGTLIARVPEKNFQQFLNDAEGTAAKVVERTVNGQDVTEEYVDLQSRLKAKKTVEARLLDFMKKAEKTENLLRISTDLAGVQEEIESIMGRIKFLDNQVAYSTVTINTFEEKVIVPAIDEEELNTWEKTKKQFAGSINFLMATLSAITVITVGNLPVLVILIAIGVLIYLAIRKRKK